MLSTVRTGVAGLGSRGFGLVKDLLMDLQDQMNLTYIFITHDLSVVKHISDNIMVMYLGQCVEYAKTSELFKNPIHPYTKALLSAIPLPSIAPEDRMKDIIKGEIVSPINPPAGCRFAARCPYASKKCMGQDIPLHALSDAHKVACVLYDND